MISEQMSLIFQQQLLNSYQEAALSMTQGMGQRTRRSFWPRASCRLVREVTLKHRTPQSTGSTCERRREQLRKGSEKRRGSSSHKLYLLTFAKKSGKQEPDRLGEASLEERRAGPRVWSIPLTPTTVKVWKGARWQRE